MSTMHKKGSLVTVKRWYMPRRVYGKVLETIRAGWNRGYVIVRGDSFGLEKFHPSTVRAVRGAK